jgi:hypothetical protein
MNTNSKFYKFGIHKIVSFEFQLNLNFICVNGNVKLDGDGLFEY